MTLRGIWTSVIEYETPRLVKIHNRKLGLVRRLIQLAIISYVGIYALWLQRGYQEFSPVESSVTIKIKGVTKSYLDHNSSENHDLYTRVWDVADYVVPPAENGAFFVATNVIITPNQTRGRCPEDPDDIDDVVCVPNPNDCDFDTEDFGQWRHPYEKKSDYYRSRIGAAAKIKTEEDIRFIQTEDFHNVDPSKSPTTSTSTSTTDSSVKISKSSLGEITTTNEDENNFINTVAESDDRANFGPGKMSNETRMKRSEAETNFQEEVSQSIFHGLFENDLTTSTSTTSSSSTTSSTTSTSSSTTTITTTTTTTTKISSTSPTETQTHSSAFSFQSTSSNLKGTKKCRSENCKANDVVFKAHGPLTGFCVPTDRPNSIPNTHTCEVESWCPIEIDRLPLGDRRALMGHAEDYTVFVKNSIAFPYFGSYVRNNLVAGEEPCLYKQDPETGQNNGCQIFKLGEMVAYAGGNFNQTAIKGGVVSMSISWNCNLDFDFMSTCLPKYSFRMLDKGGWNFREAKYHEENRRTLFKMYGIKFILTVEGRGGKFNLKNTILNVGSGLALLGVSTVICDFLLMYIKEKGVIKQKKYDYINVRKKKKHSNGDNLQNHKNGRTFSLSTESHFGTMEPVTRTTTTFSHLGRLGLETLPENLTTTPIDTAEETISKVTDLKDDDENVLKKLCS